MENGGGQNMAAARLSEWAALIDKALAGCIPVCPEPESGVTEAMAYSLLGGGKRIRGALVLAFYGLYKADVRPALPFACALEMIHAFSLIHDDLPCMDDDDLRRGKPSCHKAFGETTALLAGDALTLLAFETATAAVAAGAGAAPGTMSGGAVTADGTASGAAPESAAILPPERVLEAVGRLALAAGARGMIGGQILDLAQEGRDTPAELLLRMYREKTGALLAAAADIGCCLAGAGRADREAAAAYSEKLGLAFQITDDILDVTGDGIALGKPVGSDAKNSKTTYVSLYGLAKARERAAALTAEAKATLTGLPGDIAFLAGLADWLARRRY